MVLQNLKWSESMEDIKLKDIGIDELKKRHIFVLFRDIS